MSQSRTGDKKPRSATIQVSLKEVDKKILRKRPPIAPDGGYGWVVVLASFFCNIIVDGIIFSFGIFLQEISDDLNVSKAATAWVGSLQTGFYLIAGPFVSYLANKYNCRLVTIIGGIISAIAFGLSYKAQNIFVLCFTYGILGGIGYGFIYLPAIVIVGFYFDEKRAFATGIAVCGSGIGGFVFAPLIRLLISKYGWRSTIGYLAGANLSCVFFAIFFKPLKSPSLIDIENLKTDDIQDKRMSSISIKSNNRNSINHIKSSCKDQLVEDVKNHIIVDLNNNVHHIDLLLENDLIESNSNEPSSNEPSSNEPNSNEPNSKEPISNELNSNEPNSRTDSHKTEKIYRRRASSMRTDKNASFDTQSSMKRRSSSRKISVSTISFAGVGLMQSGDQILEETEDEQSIGLIEKTKKSMFDLSLLSSPTFLLFSCAGFLTLFGFFIPFMYIVDRAVKLNIPADDGVMILSVIGITNTFGRVICGYLTDRPEMSALVINNIALIVGGIFTILLPIYFNTYSSLIIYAIVFGFSIACFAALRSIITAELFGLERLTSAFGLLLLIQGIATMVGAPIAGWFYDLTKSYNASFYAAGIVILISGIICIFIPAVKEWETKREKRSNIT